MPKSKHGKGRRAQYRNRPRPQTAPPAQTMQTAQAAAPAAAAAAANTIKPAAPKPVINTKTAAGRAAAAALQLPHIGAELKKIALFTGIIVVVLIVLTLVLK